MSTRIWARSPTLLFGLQTLYRSIDRKSSPLAPSLRSMVSVRISQINQCEFCVDINSRMMTERGLSSEKILSLASYETHPSFDESERAALQYAETMTRSNEAVTDTIFARLRKSFSEIEALELTALIAYQNLSSKFNAALDIPSQGFCRIFEKK